MASVEKCGIGVVPPLVEGDRKTCDGQRSSHRREFFCLNGYPSGESTSISLPGDRDWDEIKGTYAGARSIHPLIEEDIQVQ